MLLSYTIAKCSENDFRSEPKSMENRCCNRCKVDDRVRGPLEVIFVMKMDPNCHMCLMQVLWDLCEGEIVKTLEKLWKNNVFCKLTVDAASRRVKTNCGSTKSKTNRHGWTFFPTFLVRFRDHFGSQNRKKIEAGPIKNKRPVSEMSWKAFKAGSSGSEGLPGQLPGRFPEDYRGYLGGGAPPPKHMYATYALRSKI